MPKYTVKIPEVWYRYVHGVEANSPKEAIEKAGVWPVGGDAEYHHRMGRDQWDAELETETKEAGAPPAPPASVSPEQADEVLDKAAADVSKILEGDHDPVRCGWDGIGTCPTCGGEVGRIT